MPSGRIIGRWALFLCFHILPRLLNLVGVGENLKPALQLLPLIRTVNSNCGVYSYQSSSPNSWWLRNVSMKNNISKRRDISISLPYRSFTRLGKCCIRQHFHSSPAHRMMNRWEFRPRPPGPICHDTVGFFSTKTPHNMRTMHRVVHRKICKIIGRSLSFMYPLWTTRYI